MALGAHLSSGTGAPGGELGPGEIPTSSFNPSALGGWVIKLGCPSPNPEIQEGWEDLMGYCQPDVRTLKIRRFLGPKSRNKWLGNCSL